VTEFAGHQAAPTSYLERFRTPWWWYPVALLVGSLLGAEFAFIVPAWLTWLPIVLSLAVSVLIVWRLSSASVRVVGTQLVAGDRSLPLTDIAQAIDLSGTELRRVVGRHGDPLAYNFIRSWVGPGVQLVLVDRTEDEPEFPPEIEAEPDEFGETEVPLRRLREPYWLVSSRHPRELIAAIQAASPLRG
jgi:hypothetical protein